MKLAFTISFILMMCAVLLTLNLTLNRVGVESSDVAKSARAYSQGNYIGYVGGK